MKVQKHLKLFALFVLLTAFSVVTVACGGMGGGQKEYPSGRITFIVPYAAGGGIDAISRQFAQQLEGVLGTAVVIENREGAAATIGTSGIVEAAPDGHTIGVGTPAGLSIQPLVNPDISYEGFTDVQPLAELFSEAPVLAVRSDSQWQTFEQVEEYAKANPGDFRVSSGGALTAGDVAISAFSQETGVELTAVPFSRGGDEARTVLLGGEVEATSLYPGALASDVEAGQLRVLTVFQEERTEVMPDVPSVVELGYNVEDLIILFPELLYVAAPNGLPEDVRNTLVEACQEVSRSEEYLQWARENTYTVNPKDPEEITSRVEEKTDTYKKVLAEIGAL
jgi:tripartite-type tricarboxylate transporter receptor subunit TctC